MMLLLKLFLIFFRIGLFAFGGGLVILPMIKSDLQTLYPLTDNEFGDMVALSNITPGPIAINAATFSGFKTAGITGAIIAIIGVILPSLIIILIVSAFLKRFENSKIMASILSGIRPATFGLIAFIVLSYSKLSLTNGSSLNLLSAISLPAVFIFAFTIFGLLKLKINPILLTVLSGIAGIIIF